MIISHFTVDGNEYKVTSLPDRFLSGMKMTKVTIQEGITSIGNYFFSNCSKLSQVILPESLTSISNGLFYGCSSLINVTIPNSVTSMAQVRFMAVVV